MNNLICINENDLEQLLENEDFNQLLKNPEFVIAKTPDESRLAARGINTNAKIFIFNMQDMNAINLAGAILHDNNDREVFIIEDKISGSLLSRSQYVGIKKILTKKQFLDEIKRSRGATQSINMNELKVIPCLNPNNINLTSEIEDYWDIDDIPDDSEYKNELTEIPSKNSNCWLLNVVSGRGGCGKSCISTMCAGLIAAFRKKVLLIDADFQFGDLKYCGVSGNSVDFLEVVQNREILKNLWAKAREGEPILLESCKNLESSEEGTNNLLEIINYSSQYFEAIIVNMPTLWSDIHAELLKEADLSLFIMDQRASAIRGTIRALEFCKKMNIPDINLAFAINKCTKKSIFDSSSVSQGIGQGEVFEIQDGGDVVEEFMSTGKAKKLLSEKNRIATSCFEFLKHKCPILSNPVTSNEMIA